MIEQMIATVQIYIHHRYNVEVNIDINKVKDIVKLKFAYDKAMEWLTQNNYTIYENN
jgi:hypothetical protein